MSAQLLLLGMVLTTLLIKRHRERPKRPWSIWALDISKQGCSAGAGHVVGMCVAILAHIYSGGASECAWYFVVYFGDCTLGLGLAITFHKLVTGAALHYFSKLQQLSDKESDKVPWWEPLVEIGNYGDPPLLRRWLIQVVFWVTCVVTARSIVGVVVISSIPVLQHLTHALDRKFEGHPDLYIFTVMVGIPIFINVGQAWIQDQVLRWKHRKKPKAGHPDEPAVMLSLQQADVIIGTPGRRNK